VRKAQTVRSDDYEGWQDSPRGRRRRPEPDADYDREPGEGSRDVREWSEGQPWNSGPAGQAPGDPYRDQPGYDRDWTGEQDPYGRTDPGGSGYYGGQPYDPNGDYPSQPPLPRGQYQGQPRGDYPSVPPSDYPSRPSADYPSMPPSDYPSMPSSDYPGRPPADYPSMPSSDYPGRPPADYPGRQSADYPSVPSADYPSQPPARGQYGYGRDEYGQPYDDRQSYGGQPGYESRPAYDSQEQYNSRSAFGQPDPYGGQDAYTDGRGYQPSAYPADNPYPEAQAGYGQSYDDYGAAARSGPMPAYTGDDQASWQAAGDTRGRGTDYDRGSRRDRRASAYQQQGAGQDGPLGGSRRSGRSMDADDDRHSGFFAGYASNDDDHYGGRPRKGRGRAAGMIALIVVVVLVAGLGLVGYHFYSQYKAAHASYTGNGYGTVTFTVPAGATAVSIAPDLKSRGVIAAVDPFVSYVDGSKNPTGLQPGLFKLHLHMGNAQAWAMLTDSKNRVNSTVTIPDGLRYSKILPLLAKESHLPLSDFQAAIKETAKLGLPAWANGNPEGFLYPATYDIVPGSTTALGILQTAAHQFNLEIAQANLSAMARQDQFTELQVITGASLLEGEVGPKYYADVARAIDNRLKIGMPLQLDSTISYATGDYGFNLSQSELNVNSPYNTFLHTDLPPGPINSPGLAAITAFLHPASSSNDWTYFCTVNKSGLTYFTNSKSQFDIWSNLAKKNGV
jgi:UPF0755 protein